MLKDFISFCRYLFIQNNYKRIFFIENKFIESHMIDYILKDNRKQNTLILTLYTDIDDRMSLNSVKFISFNKFFFLNFVFYFIKVPYLYSSTPDLNNSLFVKSIFKKTKYIYLQHSPLGLLMIYNDHAFNNFDFVQTVNVFQVQDLKIINNLSNLKIRYFKSRYLFFYNNKFPLLVNKKPKLLIAPSHSTDFYSRNYLELLIKNIDQKEYDIFFRPHIMSLSKGECYIEDIKKKIKIDLDILDLNKYDLLITDWSGIYIEYAFYKFRKSILLNTNRKQLSNIYNNEIDQNYSDLKFRNKLGVILNEEDLSKINLFLKDILNNKKNNEFLIDDFFKKNFF